MKPITTVFVLLLLIATTAITEATTSITYAQQQQPATTTTTITTNNAIGVNATSTAAASNASSPTNATTEAANNVTANSSAIARTRSETLWELEVRERRERAGLPLENNSTLPNLTKSAESVEIDRLQAEDQAFANFETVLDTCCLTADSDPSNDIMPHAQCLSRLEEASAMWCGVETYDAKKCDYVSNQSTWYEAYYSLFSPSGGLLGEFNTPY